MAETSTIDMPFPEATTLQLRLDLAACRLTISPDGELL